MIELFINKWKVMAEKAEYNAQRMALLQGVSQRQLQRIFQKHFKRSPQDWLDEQRLSLAMRLLLQERSIKEVTFAVGFKQPSHFCRKFKKAMKVTPKQFILTQKVCGLSLPDN